VNTVETLKQVQGDEAADVGLEDIHRASSEGNKYLTEHKKGL